MIKNVSELLCLKELDILSLFVVFLFSVLYLPLVILLSIVVFTAQTFVVMGMFLDKVYFSLKKYFDFWLTSIFLFFIFAPLGFISLIFYFIFVYSTLFISFLNSLIRKVLLFIRGKND